MENLMVIVAAAGQGKRLGLGYNKVLAPVGGVPLLIRTLSQVAEVEQVGQVLVTIGQGEQDMVAELLSQYAPTYFPKLKWRLVVGGKERQDSVAHALKLLTDAEGWVAVHDGARPFATPELFARVWAAARSTGAAIAAVPCKDTIKVVDASECVTSTPARQFLRAVQTPQIFRLSLLRKAYADLAAHPRSVTDDAMLLESRGIKVQVALGDYANLKITTPEDLPSAKEEHMQIGSGYDVHKLVPERKLILCGVHIPSPLGLEGHSDADVALHALSDALLGAAGLGDIGKFFPDTDPQFKDADSRKLLAEVVATLKARCWRINNVDVTIIAQRPKLAGFRDAMQANLCQDLGLPAESVNVKATTTEHLGFTGRGEGIAAQAVASIIKMK